MHIHFERTGGFAGIRLQCAIDSDQLPPAEAQQLNKLVKTAKLFDLPEHPPQSSQGADQFQYKLDMESEGRQKTIRTNEVSANDQLMELVNWLCDRARKKK